LLPDQLLFNSIKGCSLLFDCQQLLSACGQRLDAMLLSTLVTQTVYVAVGPSEQQQQLQQDELKRAGDQAPQQPAASYSPQYSSSSSSSTSSMLAESSRDSISSSKKVTGSSRSGAQALSRYLRQLSDVALQLCSSFRPQQFSNVLWGLAKCGYRAPTAWLGHYLHQVRHRLESLQPAFMCATC
jgi:hypothetical protein